MSTALPKLKLPNYSNNGNSLEVQWLGLWALTAGGLGSIPGRGTKIPQAAQCGQKQQQQQQQQKNPKETKNK